MRCLIAIGTLALLAVGINGTCPLSALPAQTWHQYEWFQHKQMQKHEWYLSPCEKWGHNKCTPRQGGGNAGYFGRLQSGGDCQGDFGQVLQNWTYFTTNTSSGYSAEFVRTERAEPHYQNHLTVAILCNSSMPTDKLAPIGPVIGHKEPNNHHMYQVTLESGAACAPTPAPEADSAVATSGIPTSGSYCGSYAGLVKGKLTIESATKVNVDISILGGQTTCNNEAWSVPSPSTCDSAAGCTVSVPDATKPGGCIDELLSKYGLSLKVQFYEKTNEIDLVTSLATVKLSKC